MSFKLLAGAMVIAAATLPSVALADDPLDPKMQSEAARERDRAMIRKLNRDMLEQVQARDAQYAAGWQAYREQPRVQAEYRQRLAAYERELERGAAERRRYEREMAEWRRKDAACRAGHYAACR
jgi:hypothetical protein